MAPTAGGERPGGPGWWKAAALGLVLGAFGTGWAPLAAAQAAIEVSAQVVSIEPIREGLAGVAGLVAETGFTPWSREARAETRLAVVTRAASAKWQLPTRGRVWFTDGFRPGLEALLPSESVTLTIAFLRN